MKMAINSIYGMFATVFMYMLVSEKLHPILAYLIFVVIWGIFLWTLMDERK